MDIKLVEFESKGEIRYIIIYKFYPFIMSF